MGRTYNTTTKGESRLDCYTVVSLLSAHHEVEDKVDNGLGEHGSGLFNLKGL